MSTPNQNFARKLTPLQVEESKKSLLKTKSKGGWVPRNQFLV